MASNSDNSSRFKFSKPFTIFVSRDNIIENTFFASVLVFVLSSFTGSIGQLVDGVIIGQCLGVDSIAAYGLISPLMFIFVLFGSIISSGSRNKFTRLVGEGKLDEANGIFSLSWVLAVGLALICMVLAIIFSEQISILLGASGNAANLLDKAKAYLIGISFGLPAMNGIRVLSAYMIIDGDKNRTVIATLVMTIVNIILDLIVAFVIHGDTFEMGITTSIGYYVSLFILLGHFDKKDILLKFSLKNIRWKERFDIIRIGLPTGVCRVSTTIRSALMNNMLSVVATSGAIAAYTVHRSADGFLNPITMGMADTVAMIAGILMGEQDRPKMKTLLQTSVYATFVYTAGIAAIVFFAAPLFASMYIANDPEALAYATRSVQCYAFGMPFYGLNLIYQIYLQGIGKSKLSSFMGFLLEGALLVISAYVMLPYFKEEAVWIAFPVTQFVMLIINACVIAGYSYYYKLKRQNLWDKILLLPDNFDVPDEDKLDSTIYDMAEVAELSEAAWDFCTGHGCDPKTRYAVSSSVEELAGNIITHGFNDGKKHSVDLRVIKKDDEYMLRMRDNCILFDPTKQLEEFTEDDTSSHLGLRMVNAQAEDIQYTAMLNLNNLIIRIKTPSPANQNSIIQGGEANEGETVSGR